MLKEYRDIFSFFDRDGGGSIGAEEFDQVKGTKGVLHCLLCAGYENFWLGTKRRRAEGDGECD